MAVDAPIPTQPPRSAYENWRPPLIGVQLLIPVGSERLLVAETLGSICLPVDAVRDGESPRQAAQHVLLGASNGIPVLGRVAVDQKQMRRRKVITHVLATTPLSCDDVAPLTYRDPRGELRILPTERVIDLMPDRSRPRVHLALQGLTVGQTIYLGDGALPPSGSPYDGEESRV